MDFEEEEEEDLSFSLQKQQQQKLLSRLEISWRQTTTPISRKRGEKSGETISVTSLFNIIKYVVAVAEW